MLEVTEHALRNVWSWVNEEQQLPWFAVTLERGSLGPYKVRMCTLILFYSYSAALTHLEMW